MAKVHRIIDWILQVFVGLCLGSMVVIAFGQVIGRYFFGKSFIWAEDLCMLLFCWSVWTTACLLLKDGHHLRLTVAITRIPSPYRRVISFSMGAAALVFLGFVIYAGVGTMEAMSGMLYDSFEGPLNLKFSSVPVGAALMVYYLIRAALSNIRKDEIWE